MRLPRVCRATVIRLKARSAVDDDDDDDGNADDDSAAAAAVPSYTNDDASAVTCMLEEEREEDSLPDAEAAGRGRGAVYESVCSSGGGVCSMKLQPRGSQKI